ncbi:hypothetical protein G6F59_017946 [Rhizopus arrhizus]|nr:hypothetical protein G6F59_017946 [Rhizopus arrhizus]
MRVTPTTKAITTVATSWNRTPGRPLPAPGWTRRRSPDGADPEPDRRVEHRAARLHRLPARDGRPQSQPAPAVRRFRPIFPHPAKPPRAARKGAGRRLAIH